MALVEHLAVGQMVVIVAEEREVYTFLAVGAA
jgi:hypothetical protein